MDEKRRIATEFFGDFIFCLFYLRKLGRERARVVWSSSMF